MMKLLAAYLAAAGVALASEKAFSIHDDLDAFSHYEILLDPFPISTHEADILIAQNLTTDTTSADSPFAQPRTPSEHIKLLYPAAFRQTVIIPPYTIKPFPTPFLCAIPRPVPPPVNPGQESATRIAAQTQSQRAEKRGWELLEGMKGQCVFKVIGWWGYKYCYGEGGQVEQFHPETEQNGRMAWPLRADRTQGYYILGRDISSAAEGRKEGKDGKGDKASDAPKDGSSADTKPGDVELSGTSKKDKDQHQTYIPPGGHIVTKGDITYLTHRLSHGTLCDLTHRPREVEIQYHCAPHLQLDYPSVIKEVTTCNYLLVIHTPRLCQDSAFVRKSAEDERLQIKCRKIVDTAVEDGDEHIEMPFVSEQDMYEMVEREELERKSLSVIGTEKEEGPIVVGGHVVGGGVYFPVVAGREPRLRPPKNWVASENADEVVETKVESDDKKDGEEASKKEKDGDDRKEIGSEEEMMPVRDEL